MKMCETILLFILLFTATEQLKPIANKCNIFSEREAASARYLCNATDVAANATISSHSFLSTPKVTQAPESETTPRGNSDVPEEQLRILLVAGFSISFVFLFILVIVGVWYARKKSKGRSASRN